MIADAALTGSAAAVIVAVPTEVPETTPEEVTAAMAPLSLVQVTGCVYRVLPAASRTTAVNCSVVPPRIVAASGVTVMLAGGAARTAWIEAVDPSVHDAPPFRLSGAVVSVT